MDLCISISFFETDSILKTPTIQLKTLLNAIEHRGRNYGCQINRHDIDGNTLLSIQNAESHHARLALNV